jgi:DNA end-binding protein Ku
MRSTWTGAISFGLVNIPVRLYSAVESSTLDLDMLDSKDHAKIRFKRVNENSGREVPYDQIVKAYNYEGNYVVLDDEDYEAAAPEKSKTIDIHSFVEESQVGSIFFEQPYYLEPEKSGRKAFALLRDALRQAGKVGVSSFVMRTKETLAIVKPLQEVLVLNRIRFPEEIRDFKKLDLPDIQKTKTKEVELALKLIDQLTEDFNIDKYHNTYSSKLLEIIAQKSRGKRAKVRKMKVVHNKPDDLMNILKASLKSKKAS